MKLKTSSNKDSVDQDHVTVSNRFCWYMVVIAGMTIEVLWLRFLDKFKDGSNPGRHLMKILLTCDKFCEESQGVTLTAHH